MKPELYFH